MTALLAVEDIHTAYGLSRVLFGVSLDVEAGECVCLLGRNGVGKTTTMRSIMGLTPPTSGRVSWKGTTSPAGRRTGWRAPASASSRRTAASSPSSRCGRTSTSPPAPPAAPGAGRWTPYTSLFPKLRELRDRQGGFLSGGEQQMLTIARTLMGNPELLLLDEPSEGLAPLVVEALLDKIGALKRKG